MADPHWFPIQIYYEDTDHSGLVYHANYLKFFERAREHFLGIDDLLRMEREEGLGFVVYEIKLKYREGATFGDRLRVRTAAHVKGEHRLVLNQDVLREVGDKVLVAGVLDLVCVDREKRLVVLPEQIAQRFERRSA